MSYDQGSQVGGWETLGDPEQRRHEEAAAPVVREEARQGKRWVEEGKDRRTPGLRDWVVCLCLCVRLSQSSACSAGEQCCTGEDGALRLKGSDTEPPDHPTDRPTAAARVTG